jgi:hypothetical protein
MDGRFLLPLLLRGYCPIGSFRPESNRTSFSRSIKPITKIHLDHDVDHYHHDGSAGIYCVLISHWADGGASWSGLAIQGQGNRFLWTTGRLALVNSLYDCYWNTLE